MDEAWFFKINWISTKQMTQLKLLFFVPMNPTILMINSIFFRKLETLRSDHHSIFFPRLIFSVSSIHPFFSSLSLDDESMVWPAFQVIAICCIFLLFFSKRGIIGLTGLIGCLIVSASFHHRVVLKIWIWCKPLVWEEFRRSIIWRRSTCSWIFLTLSYPEQLLSTETNLFNTSSFKLAISFSWTSASSQKRVLKCLSVSSFFVWVHSSWKFSFSGAFSHIIT